MQFMQQQKEMPQKWEECTKFHLQLCVVGLGQKEGQQVLWLLRVGGARAPPTHLKKHLNQDLCRREGRNFTTFTCMSDTAVSSADFNLVATFTLSTVSA